MEMKIPSIQKCDTLRYPDLEIQNEGSIFLVHIRTDTGAAWLVEHVDMESAMHFGGALVVEHRMIEDLVMGAIDSGLKVV